MLFCNLLYSMTVTFMKKVLAFGYNDKRQTISSFEGMGDVGQFPQKKKKTSVHSKNCNKKKSCKGKRKLGKKTEQVLTTTQVL